MKLLWIVPIVPLVCSGLFVMGALYAAWRGRRSNLTIEGSELPGFPINREVETPRRTS